MKYTTTVRTINKKGIIRLYYGPTVEASSKKEAKEYCKKNGLGYCTVENVVSDSQRKKNLERDDMTSIKRFDELNLN